ncbi:minor tail protein [Microbacterium phage Haunter]|nr:minor tail protein [Microbacterium phage Haunter]
MSDTLRLEGNDREIDLYPWLNGKAKGHEALAGIVGFGLPGITNHWFEGSGSGSTWRGARADTRVIKLPLKVYANTRQELNELLSDLAVALDPFTGVQFDRGPARLFFGMPDGYEWYVDVTRTGGGDWVRKRDSDDRTYFKTDLELEAGDPFWTRNQPEQFKVEYQPTGNPLLPRIAKLRVASTATTGERDVENVGDTWAWPVLTLKGPTTGIKLTGPKGEILQWDDTLLATDTLTIDMRANTVEDQNGGNRYGALAPAPQFWYIAPGVSEVEILIEDMAPGTALVAQWWPRRWAVV